MQVRSSEDVQRLGTILSVWAHPDDETFCAGGLLAAAIRNGQTVACVTATRGEAGVQNEERWPASKLGDIREKELQAALKELGITNHHVLHYADGGCAAVDSKLAADVLKNYILLYSPDTILTFGPEGLTGHPDHRAVSRWVTMAVKDLKRPPTVFHAVITTNQYAKYLSGADKELDLFFNIDQPPLEEPSECDICFCCDGSLCNCKFAAFSAMPSQYEKLQKTFGEDYLKEAFRIEAFVKRRKD